MTFAPRYCVACGSPVRPEDGRFICTGCGRRNYQNSKPCVGAIVVRDGQVLLVRRARDPFKGWWDVPGGFLDAGEHPLDGVRREIREETGLEVEPGRLIGIYMDVYGADDEPTLNLYYECAVVGGDPAAGDDAAELGWFSPEALPDDIAFENAREMLRDWLAERAAGQALRTAR